MTKVYRFVIGMSAESSGVRAVSDAVFSERQEAMSTSERDIRAWISARGEEGWSQYDIRDGLKQHHKISQPTVGRNVVRILEGEDITKKMRSAVLALFAFREEQERIAAEEDVRVEVDHIAFLEFMDALGEWKAFNDFEIEQARIAADRREAAGRALEARRNQARSRALVVSRRMQDMDIVEPGNTYVYADGATLIREGIADFLYHDRNAELVGFSPPDHEFPGGWTAARLRAGITREQRMRPSAVADGEVRPETIGIRDAFLVPDVPYFDGDWFWGKLRDDMSAWYELRDAAPGWWVEGGGVPRAPADADVDWYGNVLELETRLLEQGIFFEESILGWSDDWADEVKEKLSVLRTLKRRVACVDAAAKAGKVAGWLAAGAAILALLWFVVIPVVVWVCMGIWSGMASAWNAVVGALHSAAQAIETAVNSPVTLVVLVCVTCFLLWILPTDRERQKLPAFPWVLGAAVVFAVLTVIAMVIFAADMLSPALEGFARSGPRA